MTNSNGKWCPECGKRVVKAGKVIVNRAGTIRQQWKCMSCGRRTLNPKEENHDQPIHEVSAVQRPSVSGKR